jgi:hypothetical protein
MMIEHSRVLPGLSGTFLLVVNQQGRRSKLLVQPARQKIGRDDTVPILLIERFVSFKEGEEKAAHAEGKMIRLFPDFHFDLDLGQVVPAKIGGDLRFVVNGEDSYLEPVGQAVMYLITAHLPETSQKRPARPEPGAKFEPRFFAGSYKLYDDGRRSGTLDLSVAEDMSVSGSYYSDRDGRRYDVSGKVGNPPHAIQFQITFPRTVQTFHGLMFTGNGQAITGSSRLQDRQTGFYALRLEK